jgi:hypothetical protein
VVATAVCLLALAAHYCYTRRGGRVARLRAAPFAIVPVAAFVLQEHFERLLHDGHFPVTLLLERPILLGLALQLPFALLAYAIAWLLVRATEALVRALAGGWVGSSLRGAGSTRAPLTASLLRARVLARGYAGRGPPLGA